MKKFIITFLLLLAVFLGSNAGNLPSGTNRHRGKDHHGHNWHGKGDRHHKGVRLIHRHGDHRKHHNRSDAHSNHGRNRQGDKGLKDNK